MKIYYSLSKYIKDSFLSFLLHQRCYNFLSDTIGEPADLKAEPEVVTLLQIFLNHDGDEDRIPASQQVRACVCACREKAMRHPSDSNRTVHAAEKQMG